MICSLRPLKWNILKYNFFIGKKLKKHKNFQILKRSDLFTLRIFLVSHYPHHPNFS